MAMPATDAMQYVNQQDAATIERFIERLELRRKDPTFVGYREAYLRLLDLPHVWTAVDRDAGPRLCRGRIGRVHAQPRETYAPLTAATSQLPAARVQEWLADQRRSAADGTFFAACNYYAYIAEKN
jgi:hypothetical protein